MGEPSRAEMLRGFLPPSGHDVRVRRQGAPQEHVGGKSESLAGRIPDTNRRSLPGREAQLLGAIEAVFKSWDNERANVYRKVHGYDRAWGTAVTVQAMVFGNLNDQSASGVLFTRNPDTGGMTVTGEFLPNAQGEDIVAGIRTPQPLDAMKEWNPVIHDQLLQQVIALENRKKEMLDIEFTVQDGNLYLLQVRTGKRSATAALKIATDMVKQGLITATEAVKRVSVKQFDLAQLASSGSEVHEGRGVHGHPGLQRNCARGSRCLPKRMQSIARFPASS